MMHPEKVQKAMRNKFSFVIFSGIALVFFLIRILNSPAENIKLPSVLYLLLFVSGLWFIRKTALYLFSDRATGISLLILSFGTNLLSMVTVDFRLQQVLIFSLYSVVVYLTASWFNTKKHHFIYLLSLSLLVVTLVHPTGFMCLLIPLLWGVSDKQTRNERLSLVKMNFGKILIFFGALFLVIMIPLLIWKTYPGNVPFLGFYAPGVFKFLSPYLWSELFSFNHGWVIYSPVILLAIPGFYLFAQKNRSFFLSVFLFFILDVFVESSWSEFSKTQVFGQVAFTGTSAFLVFPLASLVTFIESRKLIGRLLFYPLSVFLILLSLFQGWQYKNRILLPDRMTPAYYASVFAKTAVSEKEKELLSGFVTDPGLILRDPSRFKKQLLEKFDFETPSGYRSAVIEKTAATSGKYALRLDANHRFSPPLQVRYDKLTSHKLAGICLIARVYSDEPFTSSSTNLVITSKHKEDNYKYRALNLEKLFLKPAVWHDVSFYYLFPPERLPEDELVAYIWYTGNSKVLIENIKVELFESYEP
jgi:hypothetical protein